VKAVAVKLIDARKKDDETFNEWRVLRSLQRDHADWRLDELKYSCFPRLLHTGTESGYHTMVMPLLGLSLQSLFDRNYSRLSAVSVVQLIHQMITCVEALHRVGWTHRSLKPANFCVDHGNNVVMIDFGSCEPLFQKDGSHVPFEEDFYYRLATSGLYAYGDCDIWNKPCLFSRKDNLMEIGYLAIYLLRGRLPWEKPYSDTVYDVNFQKRDTPFGVLCENCPVELLDYFLEVDRLGWASVPDYSKLRLVFESSFERLLGSSLASFGANVV